MSKVGEYYRELEEREMNHVMPSIEDYKSLERNKSFKYGFMAACIIIFLSVIFISCSMATLKASGSSCGESSWNPCYVKIVK
tara:strand:- start:534 stop:779 length:246 start_codon:yes stop_codon:yes gene_type:complete